MRNERGFVLVLSLLIMTILLVMGVTFLSIALHEHNIARNYVSCGGDQVNCQED